MARKRKRSTWGSVQRLPSGRWRIRWLESTPSGRRRRSETIDGSRVDAERRLAEIRVRVGDSPACPTVGEAWLSWLRPVVEARVRPSTLADYDATWRLHVAPRWESVPLDQVEPVGVQAWLSTLRAVAAVKSLKLLRRIVARAVAMGVVASSRIECEFAMPHEVAAHTRAVWDSSELSRICEAARGSFVEPLVILGAFGGLRDGEARGVTVADVSEGAGGVAVVSVSRSVSQGGQVGPTKTGSSVRLAVVPPPWSSRLLEIVAEVSARGGSWLASDGLGSPLTNAVSSHEFRRVVAAAGLEPAPFRNLRPSYETMMHWEYGVSTEHVQKLMGHSSPRMTHAVYDRPGAPEVARVVASIGHVGTRGGEPAGDGHRE